MIRFLYNVVISLLDVFLWIKGKSDSDVALWNSQRHRDFVSWVPLNGAGNIWVHCASAGELEQAIPLINKLLASKEQIVISFFSPSGYKWAQSKYPHLDIFYLPTDTKAHALQMINKIQPHAFIGVRYDFWWTLLHALQDSKIPVFYINVFLTNVPYFLRIKYFKQIFSKFSHIFVIDFKTVEILKNSGLSSNVTQTNDTKCERVVERHRGIEQRVGKLSKLMVWGSIYIDELTMICAVANSDLTWQHILVPHKVDSKSTGLITQNIVKLGSPINLELKSEMGILFELYGKATVSYVGGGFNGSVHNVLEPTVWGSPTLIGPKTKPFAELNSLIEIGAIHVVKDHEDILKLLHNYEKSPGLLPRIGIALEQWFDQAKSSSELINDKIQKQIKTGIR